MPSPLKRRAEMKNEPEPKKPRREEEEKKVQEPDEGVVEEKKEEAAAVPPPPKGYDTKDAKREFDEYMKNLGNNSEFVPQKIKEAEDDIVKTLPFKEYEKNLQLLLHALRKQRKLISLAYKKKITPVIPELVDVQDDFINYPTPAEIYACLSALLLVKDAWKHHASWLNTEKRQKAMDYISMQIYEFIFEDCNTVGRPVSVGRIMRTVYY